MSLKKKLRFQQKRFLWLPNDHTNHSTDPQPTSLQSQCLKIYQKSLIFSIFCLFFAPRFKIQIFEKLAIKIRIFCNNSNETFFENFKHCAQLETRKKYWKLMYKIIFCQNFTLLGAIGLAASFLYSIYVQLTITTQWTKVLKNDSFFEDFGPLCNWREGPGIIIIL